MRKTFLTLSLILLAAWAFADFPGSGSPISDGMGFPTSRISDYGGFPGSPIVASWQNYGLMFYAPFDDPASPLKLIRGTGTLSFTRAHDATHTATYVHPGTGLVTVAGNNALRIEANGALIEGTRTNLFTYSEQFEHASWAPGAGFTVSSNSGTAPDGNATADKIILDNGVTGGPSNYFNKTVTSSGVHGMSVFAKPSGLYAFILQDGSGNGGVFNLSSLTASAIGVVGMTATMAPVIDGWYRCVVTFPAGAPANPHFYWHFNGEVGNGISGIYLWGAQIEEGEFVSSHVPTAATTMIRNLDAVSFVTASNIDNVDGTLALQWSPLFASTMSTGAAYYLFDAGGLEAYYNATDRKIYFTDGTNTISTAALTFTAAARIQLAFSWGAAGLAVYKDGTTAASGATYTAPALNANLYIGTDTSSANSAYSNIKSLRIWNYEMPAANMGVITQ